MPPNTPHNVSIILQFIDTDNFSDNISSALPLKPDKKKQQTTAFYYNAVHNFYPVLKGLRKKETEFAVIVCLGFAAMWIFFYMHCNNILTNYIINSRKVLIIDLVQ